MHALTGISLEVRPGEVHAVIGENGEGKSTLAKIIAGLEGFDRGEMLLDGNPYRPGSVAEASQRGVAMVHQHPMLFDSLTVAQNVVLNREPRRGLRVDGRAAQERVAELAAQYGLAVEPDRPVRDLAAGERQRVEILKALHRGAQLIILDEPTTMLAPHEVKSLLAGVRSLAGSGHTVILIAHKLDEVLEVADRITVLRAGQVVATVEREEATRESLLHMMRGETRTGVPAAPTAAEEQPAKPRLVLENLVIDDAQRNTRIGPLSLELRSGEILGVHAGSASHQELLELTLVGLTPVAGGVIRLDGNDLSALSPYERRILGAAFVPSDRMRRGVARTASIHENAIATVYRSQDRAGFDGQPLRDWVSGIIRKFGLRGARPQSRAANLSGGNIQRLILGRELHGAELLQRAQAQSPEASTGAQQQPPSLLVISNPTQGVDAGGVRFIYDLLRDYASRGSAILLLTSDTDELLELSDRLAFLQDGKLLGVLPGRGVTTEEEIAKLLAQANTTQGVPR